MRFFPRDVEITAARAPTNPDPHTRPTPLWPTALQRTIRAALTFRCPPAGLSIGLTPTTPRLGPVSRFLNSLDTGERPSRATLTRLPHPAHATPHRRTRSSCYNARAALDDGSGSHSNHGPFVHPAKQRWPPRLTRERPTMDHSKHRDAVGRLSALRAQRHSPASNQNARCMRWPLEIDITRPRVGTTIPSAAAKQIPHTRDSSCTA